MEDKVLDIFLGGTCNGSQWRDNLIKILPTKYTYFNPAVNSVWGPNFQQRKIYERKESDIRLYTITPLMTGVLSIAEVVEDSNKRPKSTYMCILKEDVDEKGKKVSFTEDQLESLNRVASIINNNRGNVVRSLEEFIDDLNIKYFLEIECK